MSGNKSTSTEKTNKPAAEQKRAPVDHASLENQLQGPEFALTEQLCGLSPESQGMLLASTGSADVRRNIALQLQRSYGNAYVQRLLSSRVIQPKLTVSQPDDPYEVEADRVAKEVTQNSASIVQRLENSEEEEELQVKASGIQLETNDETENRINASRGLGEPLADSARQSLEPRFGADFSEVKVHTGTEADTISRQLKAEAFTTGQDIFFKEGRYQPNSEDGKKLIAHELTHVVQQEGASGKVKTIPIFRWAEEEHKAFGDLAAQMAMKLNWSFSVKTDKSPAAGATVKPKEPAEGESKLTPAGAGVKTEEPSDSEYKKEFIEDKVNPLKKELKKKIGKENFAEEGIGVAYTPPEAVETPEGVQFVPGPKRYMSFGDAAMLGGDYFPSAAELKNAYSLNPSDMGLRMIWVAATNVNHFFPLAEKEWNTQFGKAIEFAKQAREKHLKGEKVEADKLTEEALRYLAVGVHFLQDTFASGHQYPRALDDVNSTWTPIQGLSHAKTYHDALNALPNGLPMLYGGSFHGDFTAKGSDDAVVIESYRALAQILAIVSGKESPAPPPRANPGPDIKAIENDPEAGPIWTAMVKYLSEKKIPKAEEAAKGKNKEVKTEAGTTYTPKEIMDKWRALGVMKAQPTTTTEKLVAAALKDQSNILHNYTKDRGGRDKNKGIGISWFSDADNIIVNIIDSLAEDKVPKLTLNQVIMVSGALLSGYCSGDDERTFLKILRNQTDDVFRSAIKEITPEYIEKCVDGKNWRDFLAMCCRRFPAGENLGARYIAQIKDDDAARALVNGEPDLGNLPISPDEWIGVINALLSGVCGDDDEDAIVIILKYLVLRLNKAKLVDMAIGKSRMDAGVDGKQWNQVRDIMKAGGVKWSWW